MAQEVHPQVDLNGRDARPVLYSFRRCPYAMRARMAIAISDQPCELREVVLRNKPAELLAASPKGTVPVLVDIDGHVIEQSLDIMLWALRRNDPEGWLQPEDADVTLEDMLALVAECDGDFKRHLDGYKYPERQGGGDASEHRALGALFLARLDARLQKSTCLHGGRTALADIAIAPFVRQFAQVDATWFEAQPWHHLQGWLAARLDAPVFERVMRKYAPWRADQAAVDFPSA